MTRLEWALATAKVHPRLWSHEHKGTPLSILMEAARAKEHTEQWYAVRWERLHDLFRSTDLEGRACSIMANGTADPCEPPTYAQQLNVLKHRLERANARVTKDCACGKVCGCDEGRL